MMNMKFDEKAETTNGMISFELERQRINKKQLKEGPNDAEVDNADETSDTMINLNQSGWRYQAPMFFGSDKNPAMMSFHTGSSYTAVTSDICSNCSSKAYVPASSKTENNLGAPYQLEINQGGEDITLKTFAFTDTVCLGTGKQPASKEEAQIQEQEGGTGSMCVDDFEFYAIYEQMRFSKDQDGIIGLAPAQTDSKYEEGPLFLEEL